MQSIANQLPEQILRQFFSKVGERAKTFEKHYS